MNKGYQTYQCTVVSHQDFNLGSGIKVIGKSLIQWMKIFQPFINKNFSTDDFQNNWVHPNKWTYFWIAWIVFHRLLNREIVGKDKILPWNAHFWVGILLLRWYLLFDSIGKDGESNATDRWGKCKLWDRDEDERLWWDQGPPSLHHQLQDASRFTVGQALAKILVMVTIIKIIVAFWTHIVKHKCLLIWDNIASLLGAYREKTSILALHVLSHVLQCLWATMLFEKLI